MFSNVITGTAFTSPKANLYFKNKITAVNDPFFGDYSFISSLRAFLYNKMSEDDALLFVCGNASSTDSCISDLVDLSDTKNMFKVVNVRPIESFNPSDKERIKAAASASGSEYFQRVEALFVKEFDAMCFMNKETKSTIIFVPNLNIKKWHLMQCAILGYMPWYFNPENGLDEDDKELMYSFKKGTDDDYMKILNKIAKNIDFKTEFIRSSLVGFEQRHEKELYENTQRNIRGWEAEIRELYERISDYMKEIENSNYYLAGLLEKINQNQGDSEIMRYFMNNQALDLISVEGTKIKYVCKGYLQYFDRNEAEKYIENESSRFYISDPYSNTRYHNSPSFEDARKLFRAIFIDRLLKIRLCAAYSMDTGRMSVDGIAHFNYGGEYDCYMANPHIDYHGCIGTYRDTFYEALQHHDYIGCIESSIASALSLTVNDFTVIEEFMNLLWSNKGFDRSTTNSTKCIELPNGVCVHAKDAIEWLKEEGYEQDN